VDNKMLISLFTYKIKTKNLTNKEMPDISHYIVNNIAIKEKT